MQQKQYKLLLIKPRQHLKHYSTQIEIAKLLGKRTGGVPLALPVIAALTPDNYKIKIVDEDISSLPRRFKPDIVGISMITSNSDRGYELARIYRKKGAKVILGGPYPSFSIDEGLNHADSIVVGEAELAWKELLKDFESNNLKKVYKSNERTDFSTAVIPRWDLVQTGKMFSVNVQASRGCPYKCEFCLTTQIYGRKIRKREISDVVKEIKQLPKRNILFVDENFTIDKRYARELSQAIKPLNVSWICQSSVDVADDPELLNIMADAGCRFIFIGFESLKADSLQKTHKYQNKPENYSNIIEAIHKAGMHVYASFIIGFDQDKAEDLEVFRQFIEQSSLPVFTLSILGTSPGMELYSRLEKENRLLKSLNKQFFVGAYPVMKYKNFDNKEFFNKYNELIEHLFSFKEIRKRTIKMLEKGYFAKDNASPAITNAQKFRVTLILVASYLLSRDKEKRLFFRDIISLIKQKKLAISEAASVLLMFESITRHIRKDRKYRKVYYDEIKRIESEGAW